LPENNPIRQPWPAEEETLCLSMLRLTIHLIFMNSSLQALECVINGAQAVVECAGKPVY
jgi:hypothetical protein